MQAFTITVSLPDDSDPSEILEWIQSNALDLAYQASGVDELSSDEESELENSCSVAIGDAMEKNRQCGIERSQMDLDSCQGVTIQRGLQTISSLETLRSNRLSRAQSYRVAANQAIDAAMQANGQSGVEAMILAIAVAGIWADQAESASEIGVVLESDVVVGSVVLG